MSERREFFAAGAGLAASTLLVSCSNLKPEAGLQASEHWTVKSTPAGDVKLFLWRKRLAEAPRGPLVFVHGSSVQSVPAFDLQVPGQPQSSAMEWFARLGYDTRCFDCEGYGRSDKWRPVNADIACGADDLSAVSEFILKNSNNKLLLYGASSGTLRVGLFAQWDGIATEQDLLNFFARLPNPDKQFTVMPGIAHSSLRSRNWRMVYDLIDACCSRTAPVYTG